jgi:F-type H+-transporting ATPase subunit delta
MKEYLKIGIAYVTTAVSLKDSQKKEIEKKLLDTTSYETMEMHYAEDSSLIGGMLIRIGDRVVDSSIRTKLEHLTKELSNLQIS